MYENQIKNLETALAQLTQQIETNLSNVSELVSRKMKYQEELSKLRRLHWEEQTQRLNYDDDR